MASFSIATDLTTAGTKLTVDGKEITKSGKVVSISFYASAPSKGDSCDCNGWIDLSITSLDEDGNVKRETYSKDSYMAKKHPLGKVIKSLNDHMSEITSDDIVRYLGQDTDEELKRVVAAIMDHCKDNDIKCPDYDALLNRSLESLNDKAEDLGITFEDSSDTNGVEDTEDTEDSDKEDAEKKNSEQE